MAGRRLSSSDVSVVIALAIVVLVLLLVYVAERGERPAAEVIAAGGTGEFFSLTADEYPGIIETAVQTCRGKVPIIAGAGGPTRFAIQCAQAAEKAGAHGVLLRTADGAEVTYTPSVTPPLTNAPLPRRSRPGSRSPPSAAR